MCREVDVNNAAPPACLRYPGSEAACVSPYKKAGPSCYRVLCKKGWEYLSHEVEWDFDNVAYSLGGVIPIEHSREDPTELEDGYAALRSI